MNANKAQQFVPQLQPDVDLHSLEADLSASEKSMLALIDNHTSLAEIQSGANLSLKEVLILAKNLTKKGIISLKKSQESAPPSEPPPQASQPEAPTAKEAPEAPSASQTATPETRRRAPSSSTITAASPARRNVPVHALLRSRHASALSAEIDKLMGYETTPPEEPPPPTPAPPTPAPSAQIQAAPPPPSAEEQPSYTTLSPQPAQDQRHGPEPIRHGNRVQPTMPPRPTLPPEESFEELAPDLLESELGFSMDFENGGLPPEEALEAELPIFDANSLEAELPMADELELDLEDAAPLPPHMTQETPRIPTHPTVTREEVPTIHSGSHDAREAALEDQEMENLVAVDSFQESIERKKERLLAADLSDNKLVKEIMAGFARVNSSFQLYDPRNNAVRDALAELYSRIDLFLMREEKLILEVKPWNFLWQGETVYTNNDRESSLSFKMYRDGVRGLSFHRGFDAKQLAGLLKIIALSQSQVSQNEDDIVTLFWSNHFANIDILAVEGFKSREDDEQHTPVELLFDSLTNTKRELVRATDDVEGDQSQSSTLGSSLMSYFFKEEKPQLFAERREKGPLSYKALAQESKEAHLVELSPEHLPDLMAAFIQKVPTLLPDLRDEREQKGMIVWLISYTEELIRLGQYEALEQLLLTTLQWMQITEPGHLLYHLGEWILNIFQDPQKMQALISGVAQTHKDADHTVIAATLQSIIQLLPYDCMEPLIGYMEQAQPSQQEVLRPLLIALYEDQAAPFIELLSSASADQSVQLLYCLRDIGTPEAIDAIGEQIQHPDPKVQDTVLQMAELLFKGQKSAAYARKIVTRLLASSDALDRNRAYKVMETSKDPRWAVTLHRMMKEKQYNLDRDELEAIGRLAATLDQEKTLFVALELAQPPSRISMERQNRKDQRYGAIAALSTIGENNLKVEESLRKFIKSSSGELKDAYINAMKEIRRGGEKAVAEQTPTIIKTPDEPEKTSAETTEEEVVDSLHSEMIDALDQIGLKAQDELTNQIRLDGSKFVTLFHVLVKTAGLYEANNQIFARPLKELLEVQGRLFQTLSEVTIVGIEDQFYINDIRVSMQGANMKQICRELCHEFERMDLGGMTLREPMEETQWQEMMHYFVGKATPGQQVTREHLQESFRERQLNRYILLLKEVSFRISGDSSEGVEASLVQMYAKGLNVCEDTWRAGLYGQPPNPRPVRRMVQDFVDFFRRHHKAPLKILAFEDILHPLKTHMLNVMLLSIRMGQELGLSRNDLAELGVSAFYHDIGHVALVHKRRKGNIKTEHTEAAVAMFIQQQNFSEGRLHRLLSLMMHHKAYEAGAEGELDRPFLFARIIRVADLYDTLTTQKLLGGMPLTPIEVLQKLVGVAETGQELDPACVQALINVVGRFPTSTYLQLNDGSLALSLGSPSGAENFERPVVLIQREGKSKVPAGREIDLSDPRAKKLKITRAHKPPPDLNPKLTLIRYLQAQTPHS